MSVIRAFLEYFIQKNEQKNERNSRRFLSKEDIDNWKTLDHQEYLEFRISIEEKINKKGIKIFKMVNRNDTICLSNWDMLSSLYLGR